MPFPSEDACRLDEAMKAAYPDDVARGKACAVLMEAVALDSGSVEREGQDDAGHPAGGVVESATLYVVRDAVVAREGVNDKGQLKEWANLKDTAATLEGAPFLWGHPPITDPFVRGRKQGAGVVVNVRPVDADRTLHYDVALFKVAPPGWSVSGQDLERNKVAADLVRRGVKIANSGGYRYLGQDVSGEHAQHDGSRRAYRERQRVVAWDHVAGLTPVVPGPDGACSRRDGCGLGGHDHAGCATGCCERAEKLARELQESLGVSELVALQILADQSDKR